MLAFNYSLSVDGEYVLWRGDDQHAYKKEVWRGTKVGVLYDKHYWVLYKHGDLEVVKATHQRFVEKDTTNTTTKYLTVLEVPVGNEFLVALNHSIRVCDGVKRLHMLVNSLYDVH